LTLTCLYQIVSELAGLLRRHTIAACFDTPPSIVSAFNTAFSPLADFLAAFFCTAAAFFGQPVFCTLIVFAAAY